MEVILKEDVQDLGNTGDVVSVSAGYARNYLIPQSLAVESTRRNLGQLQHQKRVMTKRAEKQKKQAATLVDKLDGMCVSIEKPVGGNDRLYGSVTPRDVIAALAAEDIEGVSRKKVIFKESIRMLGIYDVDIKFSVEHFVTLKLWVVAKV